MGASSIQSTPPADPTVTDYDRAHAALYLRLLDAESAAAAWQDMARLILGLDVDREPEAAARTCALHLARARWLRDSGFFRLLRE